MLSETKSLRRYRSPNIDKLFTQLVQARELGVVAANTAWEGFLTKVDHDLHQPGLCACVRVCVCVCTRVFGLSECVRM